MSENRSDQNKSPVGSRYFNRPGLTQLKYRRGSHGEILKRLKDQLALEEIPEGEHQDTRPLSNLTIRTTDDPTIAILDACAVSLDVLGFYQERIANEGFLRTAMERKSIQELVRTIGYELKPGVAAGAKLSFIVEDAPGAPDEVKVPKGTKIISIPGQDEMPQTFETTAESTVAASWNKMLPQLAIAQTISSTVEKLYVLGLDAQLQPGNKILLTTQDRYDDPQSNWWDVGNIKRLELVPSENQTCVVWDKFINKTEFGTLSPDEVQIFAFRAAVSLFGKNAPIWDDLSQEEQITFADVDLTITSIAVSKDIKRLIAGAADHRLHVFELDTGNWLGSFKKLPEKVNSIAWADNSDLVASGGDDGIVRIWHAKKHEEVAIYNEHTDAVTSVAFSKGSDLLCSGSKDKTVRVWNVEKGASVFQSSEGPGAVNCVVFLEGQAMIVCGYSNGDISLLSLKDGATIGRLSGHTDAITDLSLYAKDKYLLSGSLDGTVRIWNLRKGQLDEFSVLESHATSVAFHPFDIDPSGKYPTFVTGCADGSIRKWVIKLEDGDTWPVISSCAYRLASVDSLEFSDNGDFLYAAAGNEVCSIDFLKWDNKQQFTIPPPSDFPTEWPGFLFKDNYIDLDATYSKAVPDGWVLLENQNQLKVYRIVQVQKIQRNDFMISGQVTRLVLDKGNDLQDFNPRATVVWLESNELKPAPTPLKRLEPISGERIQLDRLVTGLTSGKELIVKGKRARVQIKKNMTSQLVSNDFSRSINLVSGDSLIMTKAPGVNKEGKKAYFLETLTGFSGHVVPQNFNLPPWDILPAAEEDKEFSQLLVLKNVIHGQKTSSLDFEESLDYFFDPATVSVNGNILDATHGETFQEILGSGDGSLVNQSFALKKTPLTYVSAATAKGCESTLEVRVNDVLWQEVPSLFDACPLDRVFVTRIEDDGTTTITFGDKVSGESLPSGQENIKALYRSGSGADGEVAANTLQLLQTRPLGIRQVNNPLPASGATDPESRDKARENAPRTVLTLERIVSVRDYQDFAVSYAGIAKASAAEFIQGENHFVHLTVSAEDGKPLVQNSSLHQNLAAAVDSARIPIQTVQIDTYEKIIFNIVAKVLIDPEYKAVLVLEEAENALRNHFLFAGRDFGQDVTSSEIITCLQSIRGIGAVDLDQLYTNDSVFLELEVDFQDVLDSENTLASKTSLELWKAINKSLDRGTAKISKQAAIFRDKKGIRWRIVDESKNVRISVVKQSGKLSFYFFTKQVTPLLNAEKARMVNDIIQPAQLLLLNPDPAGTILMEF